MNKPKLTCIKSGPHSTIQGHLVAYLGGGMAIVDDGTGPREGMIIGAPPMQ